MKKRFQLVFLVFMLLLIPSVKATKVYIYPQEIRDVNINETFEIQVKVEDVKGLSAFQFYLRFNESIINTTSENIKLDFLKGKEKEVYGLGGVDHENDYLYGYALYLTEKTESGSGTLATITFQVKGRGTSALTIERSDLSNSDAKLISHSTQNGYFDNTGVQIAYWVGALIVIVIILVVYLYYSSGKKKRK